MPRPNFTGTWVFDPAKSHLEIPPPERSVFVIEHSEPRFRLDRTHQAQGTSDTLRIELTTDGTPVVQTVRGLEIRSTLRWEGSTLLIVSTFPAEGDQASNTVRYRLEAEGQVLVAEERLQSGRLSYENRWVFDKAPPMG
jgi:hypothetical protein